MSGEQKPSRFRRNFAQVLATTIQNGLSLDMGLFLAFPTILIFALSGVSNDHNQNEIITITPIQASWIASFGILFLLIGALMSSIISDLFGRKRSMILINIPFFIGWLILCQATEFHEILFSLALLEFAIGLMESTSVTFLTEITESSVKDIFIGYSYAFSGIGVFAIMFLNSLMAWRRIALICLAVPVTTAIGLCFIPESPQWLLSKNRPKEAEKSLCWLRGWAPKEMVAHEFYELQKSIERSKSCNSCIEQHRKCGHASPTLCEKLAEMRHKRTLKPIFILISLIFFANFTGESAMRPFMLNIFRAYGSPLASDKVAMVIGFINNLGNVIFACSVHFIGKRRMYLILLCGIFINSIVVSCYGFIYLPNGYNSFDQQNQTVQLEHQNLVYIPMICLILWQFFTFCGILTMPWFLLSELFPFKIRGTINGFVAGIYYTADFVSKKIYYNLETTLSLAGVSSFYCIITGFGLILMYLIFPETNNRTIEDIELHFADDSKRITDWRVSKSQILVDDIRVNDIENAKERWKVDEKVPLLQYQDKIQKHYISMSY